MIYGIEATTGKNRPNIFPFCGPTKAWIDGDDELQKKGDLTKGVQKAAVLNQQIGFRRIMRLQHV